MAINYQQKATEIFTELFHEPWMNNEQWNAFQRKAIKECNYGTRNLAFDLESQYIHPNRIDEKLNEVKQKVRI